VTDTSNKVVVVKVHRNAAGTTLPFDKLYFFPKDKVSAVPKIFGYALVLPCENSLMDEIVKLRPKVLSAYRHRRDDTLLNQKIDLDGRKQEISEATAWWKSNILTVYDLQNRVIVVPILTAKIRKKINPRYLAVPRYLDKTPNSARRARSRRRTLKVVQPADGRQAISEFAYLATPLDAPNDKVSPICNICPRQLLQLQGQCMPGQAICLKSLNFNEIGKERSVDAAVPADVDDEELEAAQQADLDDQDSQEVPF